MPDRWESRIGRSAMAALAGLSLAAIACGSSSSLPPTGDGSVVGGDTAAKSDAAASGDATTGSDASTQVADGGALDASVSLDGGACPVPLAPELSVIASDEGLKFVAPGGLPIELAVLPAGASISTALFRPATSQTLSALSGPTRVLARIAAAGCVP